MESCRGLFAFGVVSSQGMCMAGRPTACPPSEARAYGAKSQEAQLARAAATRPGLPPQSDQGCFPPKVAGAGRRRDHLDVSTLIISKRPSSSCAESLALKMGGEGGHGRSSAAPWKNAASLFWRARAGRRRSRPPDSPGRVPPPWLAPPVDQVGKLVARLVAHASAPGGL